MRVTLKQDAAKLRHRAYPEVRDQVAAHGKGVVAVLAALELLLADAKPATAAKVRAVLDGPDAAEAKASAAAVRAVKARFPKSGDAGQ